MEFDRAKNSKRNIIFGILSKIEALLLPFVVRTLLLKEMGEGYLGLNGLFTSVLTVLSMAELGFSNAIIYSMYKPVAEGDVKAINALLKLYRKVYRCVGCVILIIGLVLIPFLPYLIKGYVPSDIHLTTLYLIYLMNTVLSYFAFAYLRSIVSVYQREDLLSKVTMAISALQYILQAILVICFHNYYIYAIVLPAVTLLNNFFVAAIVKRNFPELRCEGSVSDKTKSEIAQNLKGLVVAKVGGVSRNAFDSIFISAFLGLVDVAIYDNYYYISNSVTAIMVLIINSITAGIGNSIVTESKEKNYQTMKKLNFLYMWIAGWCTTCLLCLYQPFMKIWAGSDLLLPVQSMVLFCVYFYALKLGDIQSVYMTTAGLFYEFRFCAILQAILNIVLNYFLVQYMGINGIVLATVISILAVDFAYGNQIVFRFYFKNKKQREYYFDHLKYFLATFVACMATYFLCTNFNIVLRALICIIVPNVIYIALYHRMNLYQIAIDWILGVIGVSNIRCMRKLFLLKSK